jgi:hypothetical protein
MVISRCDCMDAGVRATQVQLPSKLLFGQKRLVTVKQSARHKKPSHGKVLARVSLAGSHGGGLPCSESTLQLLNWWTMNELPGGNSFN